MSGVPHGLGIPEPEQTPPAWQRVLAALGPAVQAGAGPLLAPMVAALTSQLVDVDDLTRSDEGIASLYDLATSPRPGWLGQWAGVPYDRTLNPEQQRARVLSRGQTRGTPGGMLAAVRALLIGERLAQLDERDGSAYRATLRTVTFETPDVVAVRAAARAAKPVGIVLLFGWLYHPDERAGWGEDVVARVFACPMPSATLYPSEGLYPC